jgi:hypothetical protein
MMLSRLARARVTSWLAAVLWTWAIAAGVAEPRTTADRQVRESTFVERADALPVARSISVDATARVGQPDRWTGGVFVATPESNALRAAAARRIAGARSETEVDGTPRPRRLAFKYDATAPPRSL